jgi:hypothetical protein
MSVGIGAAQLKAKQWQSFNLHTSRWWWITRRSKLGGVMYASAKSG